MILTIIFGVILGIGIWRAILDDKHSSYSRNEWGVGVTLFGGIFLVTNLLCWGCCYYDGEAMVVKFEATRLSIENARNYNIIERIQLQNEVIRLNKWLASQQYWNTVTMWDSYIPDSINDLTPIR